MKGKAKQYLRRFVIAVFFLVFFAAPVCLYTVVRLGFPPVIGNLLAAWSMTSYAAQAHPDWTPEGGWANYNLVVDGYSLSFTDGMRSHSLGYANGVVQDSGREEALEAEFDIAKALRINGLHNSGGYHVYWSARWPAKTPDQPQITVVVDFFDSADTPVPDEAAMREKMADEAMRAYEALSPACPSTYSQLFRPVLPRGKPGAAQQKCLEHHPGEAPGGGGVVPGGHFVRCADRQIKRLGGS